MLNPANFPSCEACNSFHTKIRKGTPCQGCPKPVLEEGNIDAWNVFILLNTQIRTAGMGGFLGFDFSALPFVLEARHIPRSEWIFTLDKIAVLSKVASKHWNADKPKA